MAHHKLWGGRFKGETSALMRGFSSSLAVDRRLARADLAGSIAHAQMLGQCKIIPTRDARAIVRGLKKMLDDLNRGRLKLEGPYEDIHSLLQDQLEKRIGAPARRLHTARSRNDQVVLDEVLFLREAIPEMEERIAGLQRAFLVQARQAPATVMPATTHFQPAAPVLWAHHLLSYVEALERDKGRLADARRRLSKLPLGACAVVGSNLKIDRHRTAQMLGFSVPSGNSIDTTADRDFLLETMSGLAILSVHLSRWAEELVIWSNPVFGYVCLPEAFCTGSSMMPHKRNPDAAELVRGKTGSVIGALVSLLVTMKGLPQGYSRDLQEDKGVFFASWDTVADCLAVMTRVTRDLEIQPARMSAALDDEGLYMTDLMEQRIGEGISSRDAHDEIGRLVALAEAKGVRVGQLTAAQLRRAGIRISAERLGGCDPDRSVRAKQSVGSTNPQRVAQEWTRWHRKLGRTHCT